MYDTIHAYLSQSLVDDVHLLSEVPVYLTNITEHQNEYRLSYSGNARNLKIYVSEKGISIKGSLTKYYLGDNLQSLTIEDAEKAVSKLSDELHLNIGDARISRLDFANNLIMDYEPKIYFPYLGECQHFMRSTYPTSLYYSNRKREKTFYDKSLEMKNKREIIPEDWKGKNILRYEIRYKKNLSTRFKVPEVNLSTLYSKSFYSMMITRYVDEFNTIHKIPEFTMDLKNMGKPNDFTNQMYLKFLDSLGDDKVNSIIEELRERDVLERPEYYSRIKSDIRKKRQKYNRFDSESDSLLKELEDKIAETAN